MHNEIFETNKDIKETKIAIFSDIHYYPEYNMKILNKLTKQLKDNKPNYIAILGDILDSTDITDFKPLEDFLIEISTIAPVIVVLGNHDEKKGHMNNWSYGINSSFTKFLKKQKNIYLLDDNKIIDKDKNICFYGFNLTYDYYETTEEKYETFVEEVSKLKREFDSSTYNITLIHSPINIYKFIKNNPDHNLSKTDLILAGHMHNGALPFIITNIFNKLFKTSRSIISPKGAYFPKYSQGRIHNDIVEGYTYEGISKLSHSTRFFHNFDFIYSKNIQFITIKKSSK